ncbi:MAG TPA: hypothetical protein ENK09_07490 [Nitrospirae bacterium]|nr:hypothetical protein [Nitrospirota bacterium]
MRETIKVLKKSKPYLFWDVAAPERLSEDALVEIVLTRGDFDDVLLLIKNLGLGRVAEIFFTQIKRKRSNYKKRTENFFALFFKRHMKDA